MHIEYILYIDLLLLQIDDFSQAYAAGFLEGWLTAERILQAKINLFASSFYDSRVPLALLSFVQTNLV